MWPLTAECRQLQQRDIQQGISWERAARAYLALYKEQGLARQPDYFKKNDERRERWN